MSVTVDSSSLNPSVLDSSTVSHFPIASEKVTLSYSTTVRSFSTPNPELSQETETLSKMQTSIYAQEVTLLKSSSLFARVATPMNPTEETGFTLTLNPFEIFNITETAGIIYIARPNRLAQVLPTSSLKIEVLWKEHREQINVVMKAETIGCKTTISIDEFCSQHDNQKSCESSCGIGSKNGRCKWRSHRGSDLISSNYATCVSDLEYCADHKCDALEALGSSLGYQICPQDCSKRVIGNVNSRSLGISASSKDNVCTCNEFEECLCGPVITSSLTTELTPDKKIETTFIHPHNELKCGVHCMTLLIVIFSLMFVSTLMIILTCLVSRHLRIHHRQDKSLNSLESYRDYEKQPFDICAMPSIRQPSFEFVNEIQHQGHPDFYSKQWEIDISKVKVEGIIGEGEFGKVMLASLKSSKEEAPLVAAFKTVKDIADESQLLSLKKEFEQLQKVSVLPHANVIKLIGCYSKGPDPWIFLEFCLYESLKDYLLASRLIPVRNGTDGVDKVNQEEVLRFSLEIARGMAHLAELKLVHRDLAARNVLLSSGKICKISDFGLTRNVCSSCDTYSKRSDDKVPVKWMALESLSINEEYTTKSDVWSFGIVGYELIMLGSSPYPGIAVNHSEILNLLLNGYRMERPVNCSAKLFEIFQSCWNDDQTKRPSFNDLVKKFQDLIKLSNVQLTSYYKSPSLWSTPGFSAEEMFNYDEAYYRTYIKRIKQACTTLKVKSLAQKAKIDRRRSNVGDLIKSKSESYSYPVIKACSTFRAAKSETHVDNAQYDSKFDAMKFMRIRRDLMSSNQTNFTNDTTPGTSFDTFGYLPMKQASPGCHSLDLPRFNSATSTFISQSSGYILMENWLKNNASSSISASTSGSFLS